MIDTKYNYSCWNIWSHLTVCKQLEYLCNSKLGLTHSEIRLSTNFWLTNHMYNHIYANKLFQARFRNVIYKVCV